MFRRILLNPLAEAGVPAPQAAAAQAQGTPPASVPAPAAPAMVPLTVEEYQRLRGLEGQLSELRTAKEAEIAAKEAERIKALADKGQVDLALEETRKSYDAKLHESTTRFAELERQIFAERKNAVIGNSFAGVVFAGSTVEDQAEAASQLRTLLDSQFETVRDASGQLLVRDKTTGRPASEVIKESLASRKYAHFLAPDSRGGSGAPGNGNAPPPLPAGVKPGSLEHIASQFAARQGKYPAFGLTPGRIR